MPCAGEAWLGLGLSGRPVKSGGGVGAELAARCGAVEVARKARGRGCEAVAGGGGGVAVGGGAVVVVGGRCGGGDDMALTREDRS